MAHVEQSPEDVSSRIADELQTGDVRVHDIT